MADIPSMIAFGSISTWPPSGDLQELRRSLLEIEHLQHVKEAICRLPELWKTLLSNDNDFVNFPGDTTAKQLAAWVISGEAINFSETQNNALSLPLTIVAHLCDYTTYLHKANSSHAAVLDHASNAGGVQGFCAGLLSALAVAGAADEEQVGFYGALSVSLAFAIGAYVDLDSLEHGQSSCLALRRKSSTSLAFVEDILDKYDQAYVSVIRGTNDATATVPSSLVSEVSLNLASQGVSVLDTGIKGRYHTQDYEGVLEKVVDSCKQYSSTRFGEQHVVRSDKDGKLISHNDAIQSVARSILLERSNWSSTLEKPVARLIELGGEPLVLAIGSDAGLSSISKKFKIMTTSNMAEKLPRTTTVEYPPNAIAVVGMSCKFPGADSLNEFWQLLLDGKSMVQQAPQDRWPETVSTRGASGTKKNFWGNFMQDVDSFDHRFFHKSSREAASMDPQQRLLLQGAYEAMEHAGYFSTPARARSTDIGCYVGLCAVDYDANVASHPPNAFSSLGTLRAFLSGKLSHFFGWSGPSITFDTACSSSAVAIHTACRAIQAGDCSQALAGGVSLFSSPFLFENLSAAHFLSPTGATKPFDAKADGYCRGEGLGLVVLKKLSAAMADGDDIFAVIGGSAINQNDNCVPITVPNGPSQGSLFQKAATQAGILPHQVSFVESHGTGTPVGDPIEMDSIRKTFGGPQRRNRLVVSSVKGNIGHLEGASGVAGLIKAILQMENRTAVVQASFQSLNPKIPPLAPDNMVVPTSNSALPDGFLTACINNYGAAGSNSTMMVMQAPRYLNTKRQCPSLIKYPVTITANSEASLRAYCEVLMGTCQKSASAGILLGSIAFQLAKRQNQTLPYYFTRIVSDLQELKAELTWQVSNPAEQHPSPPSLILSFGGQVRDYVGLSENLVESFVLLRFHLNRCDEILRSQGYTGLYPAIFQTEPIDDIVVLHSATFAWQYASAMTWIDSGLTVDAVIGHSLGQLTALCVSGTLTLEDGIKFVAGRATFMKKHWGSEPGAMILVEADYKTISSMQHSLEVACYNGPSSHVLVGSRAGVDEFEKALSNGKTRFKRLQVTNGFHSKFTDAVIDPLRQLASTLRFRKPNIPIETCSEGSSWPETTANLLAEHTRDPVFFSQAVQRLSKSRGPCTWLEAGSDSGIIGMTRRALDQPGTSEHGFQPLSLLQAKSASTDAVAEVTAQLWKRGHSLRFWAFHQLQRKQYTNMHLPPYQWERNKHWLPLLPPPSATLENVPVQVTLDAEAPQFVSLVENGKENAVFKINPRCDEYKQLVSGHIVAGSPLCPATVYMEIAARASKLISTWEENPLLGFSDLKIDSPLGMASDRDLTLEFSARTKHSWDFSVLSHTKGTGKSVTVRHAVGSIELNVAHESIDTEFSRYERLTGPDVIQSLYDDPDSECVRGPTLYKIFSRVVEYGPAYRGLKSVAAKGGHIAGTVVSSPEFISETALLHPQLVDSWMQISGVHANAFHSCPDGEVYVFTKLDRIQFGPYFQEANSTTSSSWIIYSNLVSSSAKELANDIFVFDASSKRLVVLILGARFNNVRLNSLNKVLSKVNDSSAPMVRADTRQVSAPVSAPVIREEATSATFNAVHDTRGSIFKDLCVIFENVAEVSRNEVKGNLTVEDLGIDSLMMMEVISELSDHFAIDLPVADMVLLTDVNSLIDYLLKRGCGSDGLSTPSEGSSITSRKGSSDSSISPASTPPTERASISSDRRPSVQVEELAKLLQDHLELESTPGLESNLAAMGLDSLLAIELGSDIEKMFSVSVDLYQIDENSTLRDLANLAGLEIDLDSDMRSSPALQQSPTQLVAGYSQDSLPSDIVPLDQDLPDTRQVFDSIRLDFDKFSAQEGFTDFWRIVYPEQARLVESYIVGAFEKLGCNLANLPADQRLPELSILDKHKHLLERMHKILADGGYVDGDKMSGYRCTSKRLELAPPQTLLSEIISKFPLNASEHRLLNVTGSQLAECLTGKADPLALLFANKTNRQLLADVYDLSPVCRAATRLLASFMEKAFPPNDKGKVFHFLEVGAGTGGTTKFLVEYLTNKGVRFTYTFTDISSALVCAAKKKFAAYDCMRYATLNVDGEARHAFAGKYDAVISTNCIHATRNATTSLANVRSMLQPDGVLALVEFTNGMYWFDLVFGLLDGWWLFSDGRQHALGDTAFWNRSILAAGYKQANWSDGSTPESQTLRFICGFNSTADSNTEAQLSKRGGIPVEAIAWKNVDGLELNADVYYPLSEDANKKRPVALLFHGGGHVLFTRKDIHTKHMKTLLDRGFLPVSVDYRLCPEVSLAQGPMEDACDALHWARTVLPITRRARKDVQLDPGRVTAVGWSAGGHLAMTLAFTAPAKGIDAPDSIFAFYCPSNFEADWWKSPIYPKAVHEKPGTCYDLLEGIEENPIAGYKPGTKIGAPMTLQDPRWRIVIHYNWKAQLVPVLVQGLPSKAKVGADAKTSEYWNALDMPSTEAIQAVSPYAQILKGRYRTPTFIVHGNRDDLIPWQQSRDTIQALAEQGIEARLAVPSEAGHAFDLWSDEDPRGTGWAAVLEGYDFICRFGF